MDTLQWEKSKLNEKSSRAMFAQLGKCVQNSLPVYMEMELFDIVWMHIYFCMGQSFCIRQNLILSKKCNSKCVLKVKSRTPACMDCDKPGRLP